MERIEKGAKSHKKHNERAFTNCKCTFMMVLRSKFFPLIFFVRHKMVFAHGKEKKLAPQFDDLFVACIGAQISIQLAAVGCKIRACMSISNTKARKEYF